MWQNAKGFTRVAAVIADRSNIATMQSTEVVDIIKQQRREIGLSPEGLCRKVKLVEEVERMTCMNINI
jgi:hypothetical protein